MASNNPWADAESQGNPFNSPTSDSTQGQQGQAYYQPYQQNTEPCHDEQQYQPPSGSPPTQQSHQQQQTSPTPGIRRSETEQLLEQQEDRGEQFEHMQQYEARAPQSEDDKVQAQLQNEYPNIDSSLIAAIYNERKGQGSAALGEVREMLQELNRS